MKLAVSVQGKDLNAQVDPRFGRAAGFLIVDEESLESSYLDNSAGINASHGAGIQAARTVADAGVGAVITGNCGPKAFQALQAAGIKIYTFEGQGSAAEAVKKFKAGQLTQTGGPSRPGHWG